MRTAIMGILNVTPDSFSDGGRLSSPEAAIQAGLQLSAEGASILDIGGESTRPNAEPIPEDVELARVLPVVQGLAAATSARLSIDTIKPRVAEACLRAGATIVNDVTGLRDPGMARIAAAHRATVVIMHMRGTPQTMRQLTQYGDVIADIASELAPRLALARDAGISDIIVDPGIGFAKTPAQSYEILARLSELSALGYPLLVGPSRKSFLASISGCESPAQRLEATLAAAVISALHGASILRVHDVAPCRKALDVVDTMRSTPWTKSS